MPITSSAKKALRASRNKRVFNIRRKSAIEKLMKEFRKHISAKDKVAAQKMVSNIYQALDKAVKTKYVKANTSSRTKSRVMAAIKRIA